MRNFFMFGDIDSRDYGVYISGQGTYDAPTKDVELIKVPGRSGDLTISNNRFENIELTYPAFIYADFKTAISRFKEALLSVDGYQELEDSYAPDEYRRAIYTGDMKVDATTRNDAGQFDIVFNCDPRRFLKVGKLPVTMQSGGIIENPTKFDTKPLIRVTGYGTLTIGSITTTIAQGFSYIDIDCEMMDCYHGTDNANSYVTFSDNDFLTIPPGRNGVTFSGNISSVVITPRWWRI